MRGSSHQALPKQGIPTGQCLVNKFAPEKRNVAESGVHGRVAPVLREEPLRGLTMALGQTYTTGGGQDHATTRG
jgi:hypothetical protein